MANINLMLKDNLKAEFKSKLALDGKQITATLIAFIKKYNSNPSAAKEFLYSSNS